MEFNTSPKFARFNESSGGRLATTMIEGLARRELFDPDRGKYKFDNSREERSKDKMPSITPTRYELHSNDNTTKVSYFTSNIAGQPALTLTQGTGPARNFVGSQIRTVSTEIGTLVSVTTHMTIDTGSTSFSVLIPAITLSSNADHKAFTTEAIVTSHSGPIPVLSDGV